MNKNNLMTLMLATGTFLGCNQKSDKTNDINKALDSSAHVQRSYIQNMGGEVIDIGGGEIVRDVPTTINTQTIMGKDTSYVTHDYLLKMRDGKTMLRLLHAEKNKEGIVVSSPELHTTKNEPLRFN